MHKIPNSNASNRGSLLRCKAAGFLQAHRFAVLASVVLLTAVGPMPRAFAQAFQVNQPINFTLSNSQCVPLPVQGTGEQHLVINERIDSSGGTYLQINDLSNGRATDSAGGTYTFSYHAHASVYIPPGGYPQTGFTTDRFILNGKGRDNQLHVGFVLRFTVNSAAPGDVTVEIVNVRGNPDCDPL
jgi:hypothetical protein